MRAIIVTIVLLTLSGCHYGHGPYAGYHDGGYSGGRGGYHGDRHHHYGRGDYDRHRGPGDRGSRYWRR